MTNVLIVEDEQAIRRFLRAALEGDGLHVYEAEHYNVVYWKPPRESPI